MCCAHVFILNSCYPPPSLQIAVLKEMDAKGPFVSLVMGVVVLKDVVVIVAFALTMELVPMVRAAAGASSTLRTCTVPLMLTCVYLRALYDIAHTGVPRSCQLCC